MSAHAERATAMKHNHDEIPSDAEVLAVLNRLGNLHAGDLVRELEKANHSRRDAQRAIQRCLDRGSIRLGQSLRLAPVMHATARAA